MTMARRNTKAPIRPSTNPILLSSILILAFSGTPITGEPVNVALKRPVTALYTCGTFGTESYNTILDADKSYNERQRLTCSDLRPNGDPDAVKTPTHGPAMMVDGDLETFWQSTSRNRRYFFGTELNSERDRLLEVLINMDLQQEFLAEKLVIQLGDALSPQKIEIRKSLDGKSYVPWIYAVSSATSCGNFFSTSFGNVPSDENSTVCLGYVADRFPPGDTITLDISAIPDTLKEWSRIRYLEIKFFDMLFVYPYNHVSNTFNHYAIRELQVMAECPCNGQQSDCQPSPTTGQYECVCGGNTKGRFCESCMAMFNQYLFQQGVSCRECNCFNHATSCYYRPSVEQTNDSIDKDGNKNGGGVCLDCQHNTAGINCERCASTYYRSAGTAQTAENACAPCGCSAAGSTINPANGIVDCVMNDDDTRTDGKVPGDCFCKANVQGNKCDKCKSGFYKLDKSHDEGCIECACFTSGTVDASTICQGDSAGQCPCKTNVQGRECNECKDGFYGLTDENTEGCVACDCDIGGAVDQKCVKSSGQCVCRSSNIVGRTCNSVKSEFYYPGAHAIHDEFEGSFGLLKWKSEQQYSGFSGEGYAVPDEQDELSVLLDVPDSDRLSGEFILVIVYRSPDGQTLGGGVVVDIVAQPDQTPASVALPVCTGKWCQASTGVDALQKLWSGANVLSVKVTSGAILLDKIVAVPIEYTKTSEILPSSLPTGCDFLKNTIPESDPDATTCKQALFSVTMYYWESGLPCNCDVTGSANPVCDPHGGQCDCHEGIIGRQCDKCAADHFGFSSTGCAPCDCDSLTSSCDPLTGQCECPDNTFGRQCELCLPGSWGWDKTLGCKECNCDPNGAAFTKCNDTTGICTCKPGVKGDKCDQCEDNFYNLDSMGCSPCECNVGGSTSTVCNKTSGACECKSNTQGKQCDRCLAGTYGLAEDNLGGCLECVCMGVTTQCSPSLKTFNTEPYALSKTSENGTSPNLRVATNDGAEAATEIQVETGDNDLTSTLIVSVEAGQSLYWQMPDSLTSNLLSLYGSSVSVVTNYINVDGQPLSGLSVIIRTSDNKVIKADFGAVSAGRDTEVSVAIRETVWKLEGSATALERKEFLKVLARGSAMLVPASYSSGKHTSRLSRLQFNVPNENGAVNPAVELCECGASYSGDSCQRCAQGFKRTSGGLTDYFGECTSCECNGHATVCDEDTSQCIDCAHNTVGSSCEKCAVGFYGDATGGTVSDCLPCPCFQPRVVDAACHKEDDNGTTAVKCDNCREGYVGDICNQCADAYYGNPGESGGTCTACNCNGNADSCDSVTGICQSCQSNTVGENCEKCADTFYGDASQQNCQACNCQNTSSTTIVCDSGSGQCPCVTGVGARTCDQCLADHWGFNNDTFTGCQACGCNAAGSVSTQCESDTGKCTCKGNTEGRLCDSCSLNYFGLPDAPCEACACDVTGTVAETNCNATDGQCVCQPGIGGRKCDQCLPLYVNFTSTGCVECDQCQRALGSSVEELKSQASLFVEKTRTVFAVQDEDTRLQNLTTQLEMSLEQVGLTGSDATSVSDVLNNITSMQTDLQNSFTATNNQVTQLSTAATDLKTKSSDEEAEQQEMLNSVTGINTQLKSFERDLSSDLQTIVQYNNSASKLAEQGKGAGTIDMDLSSDTSAANDVLGNGQRIRGEVEAVVVIIESQRALTSSQMTSLEVLKGQYDNASLKIDDLTSELNTVTFDVGVTENSLDGALTYKSQAEELLESVESILDDTDTGNTELNSALTLAQKASTDSNTLYGGDARPLMQGEEGILFPNGVTNYENGKERLGVLISAITLLVDQTSSSVAGSEGHVGDLETQLETLNSTFKDLPTIGKEANAAIENYELVIEDLDKSVQMADTASNLITQVQNDLSGDALDTRKASYELEKQTSETFRDELVQLDYEPQVLENTISSQQDQLDKEVDDWAQTDVKVTEMNAAAQELAGKLEDNQLTKQLDAATTKVREAATQSENVANSVSGQTKVLKQKETELETTKGQIAQVKQLDTKVRSDLNNHLTAYSDLESKLNDASSARDTGLETTQTISDKIKLLEAKLAKAEGLLERLRQPRTFDGSLSLQINNPKASTASDTNSLSLNVRKAAGFTDGNIFFTENDGNDEEFEIGMKSSKVFFEFSTGGTKVTVDNPAEICDDCWAKVVASRLGNVGYLSVTELQSGQVTTSSSSGQPQSITNTVTLTTPLYVGSLPQDTNIAKVTNKQFKGCLMDINFESQAINLWSAAVSSNQEAKCCDVPPSSSPATLPDSVSFSGIGFLVISNPISSTFESLSLEFRTYSPSGTIFFGASEDSQSFFSLSLIGGAIVHRTKANGNDVSIQTDIVYNVGKWVKVSILYTTGKMSVNFLDAPGSVETKDIPSVDLSFLDGRNIIIGASSDPFTPGTSTEQAAQTLTSKVDDTYFSGCLRNVQHKLQSATDMVVWSLDENIIAQSGVSFGGCFQDITKGLRFLSDSATAQLDNERDVSSLASLQMEFTTTRDNGVLLYVGVAGSARHLYVGIFGGHVLLKYQQDSSGILISERVYVSDGQIHTLSLDMRTSRVSMRVDGVFFEEPSETLTAPRLTFAVNSILCLGGTNGLSLEAFPASKSFMGGVMSLTLNGSPIDLKQSVFETLKDVSFSGLPRPTPVAITNDDCAPKATPPTLPKELGILLTGTSPISWSSHYTGSSSQPLSTSFSNRFTMEFDFASYKSDGVFIYAANSLANPTHYFTIYMEDGQISLKMKSALGLDRVAQMSGKYNNAQRFKLIVSRENDFATVQIAPSDFANTGVSEVDQSALVFPPDLAVYVGGVGNYDLQQSPLPASFQTDTSKANYAGALHSVKMTVNGEDITLAFTTLDQLKYPAIPQTVTPGVSLSGQDSYLGLGTASTSQQKTIELKFSTTTESALLFALYEDANYIIVDYHKHKINLHLSPTSQGVTEPIDFAVFTLAGTSVLCDAKEHTVSFEFATKKVTVTVDGVGVTSAVPFSHTVQAFGSAKLTVGGLPGDAPTFAGTSRASMAGCVESVKLTTRSGTTNFDPTQYGLTSHGVGYGCAGGI